MNHVCERLNQTKWECKYHVIFSRRELAQKPDPLLIIGERMKRLGLARLSPQELGKQRTFFVW